MESTYLNERAFIAGIKNRDKEAACYFFDVYSPILLRIISCHVHDKEPVEICLKETMVAIWENMEDYNYQEFTFKVWMAGKARKISKKTKIVAVTFDPIPPTDLPFQFSDS